MGSDKRTMSEEILHSENGRLSYLVRTHFFPVGFYLNRRKSLCLMRMAEVKFLLKMRS